MNNLDTLNNELFSQLRKLSAAGKDDLNDEIERTKAVCQIATSVVSNATLALKAKCIANNIDMPGMLQLTDESNAI